MTKIAVIVGSVRENRVTDKLAKWAAVEAARLADVEVLDLRDYPLPLFAEGVSPRFAPNYSPVPEAKKWIEKMAEFDGYVIATAEYNRSVPGVLKNAFDYLDNSVADKPVALLAHGSTGGAQAVASLRITLPGNGLVTLPNALFFSDSVGQAIDEEGVLKAEFQEGPYNPQVQLSDMAQSIVKYAEALKAVR
jgi:NAD(P)H-dependent FMN reductase